jgi:hypothetical protein
MFRKFFDKLTPRADSAVAKEPPGPAESRNIRDVLSLLNRGLELGLINDAMVLSLCGTLDQTPETLLPDAHADVMTSAFLLWKCERADTSKRILFTCLAWYLQNSKDSEAIGSITQSIRYLLEKDGDAVGGDDIERLLRTCGPIGKDSWGLVNSDLTTGKPVIEVADNTKTGNQDIPLSTFRGYLRCHRPKILNEIGRRVFEDVFPNFSNTSIAAGVARVREQEDLGIAAPISSHIANEAERLIAAGVQVKSARHRRYAGGDGLLPRGCYYSVCTDEFGDDGGTLCRELFEYRYKNAPGIIFVGDSADRELFDVLKAGVGFKPGYSAVCIMAFPPTDRDGQDTWMKVYQNVLELVHGQVVPNPFITLVETTQNYCEIDNVIDMRLPETQAWIHERFTREAFPYYVKETPTRPRFFVGMLPSLMHFEYGGCGLTDGIGSWLRAHNVNGLIFPSARSDVSVISGKGTVAEFHGWNFVDYREAHPMPVMEAVVDVAPWDSFDTRGISVTAQSLDENLTSWAVQGIETYYRELRSELLEGLQ